MRFEIMYPRLIICYYIHVIFLSIPWKPFKQFARRPNMNAFYLIEHMWGPPSAFLKIVHQKRNADAFESPTLSAIC